MTGQSDFFGIAPWREQMLEGGRVVVWFSCGAASAVASYLSIKKYSGKRPVHLVYTDPGSEDADNKRFMTDCERWLGQKVEVLKSAEYKDVDDVVAKTRFMRGFNGARCTGVLKRALRHQYQRAESDIQVFGFDARPKEVKRAERFRRENPEVVLETPLIDEGLDHAACLATIKAVGIELPLMYRLGYNNANCWGCLKAEGAGYWNMVRRDRPDVFAVRAKQERELNYALVTYKGERVFLDELPKNAGDYSTEPQAECGVLCQTIAKEAEDCEV